MHGSMRRREETRPVGITPRGPGASRRPYLKLSFSGCPQVVIFPWKSSGVRDAHHPPAASLLPARKTARGSTEARATAQRFGCLVFDAALS